MKKNKKAPVAYEIDKKKRKEWGINPVTRVKEDERLSVKKRRQDDNKNIKRFYIDEYN